MGVIQRQSIKQSIVNYFGVVIGALSTFFIYSQAEEAYGIARFVIDTSMLIVPIVLLGSASVSVKFFPQVQQFEESTKRSFLFYLFVIASVGAILVTITFLLFKEDWLSLYRERAHFSMLSKYFAYTLPVALLLASFGLLNSYILNFKRIVVPAIFQQLLVKISLPILIGLVILSQIDYVLMIYGIIATYVFVFICLLIYLKYLGRLDVQFNTSLFRKLDQKSVFKYSAYSLFAGIGGVLAYRIDSYMISTLVDFSSNGVYGICLFIGGVIAIPTNAITQISAPMISEALHENKIDRIEAWYKSASLNLLVLGLIIFVLTILSVEELFELMPKYNSSISEAFTIVACIGLAKLIDMGASINNQIIGYSKYYRLGLYTILILAVINIGLNLYLIPKYQIVGAALATLIAITFNNVIKFLFILWKFKIQPFSLSTLKVIILASVCYLIGSWIPDFGSNIINIAVKSLIVFGLYAIVVLGAKISPEINELVYRLVKK